VRQRRQRRQRRRIGLPALRRIGKRPTRLPHESNPSAFCGAMPSNLYSAVTRCVVTAIVLVTIAVVPRAARAQDGPSLSAPITYAELLPPLPTEARTPSAVEVIEAAKEATPAPGAVEAIEGLSPAIAEAAPVADALAGPPVVYEWYQPAYWFGPTPWDSGFELGLNGASGVSESISIRTGGFIKREAKDYKLAASLYYNKTSSLGVEVQSNALFDGRYDWLFDDSPWSIYVLSQAFYDEFQSFDINFNIASGIAYQWIKSDRTSLTTSFGPGTSREFGGIRDEWVAEANFGVNFTHKITEGKKFYAKVDYFPEWEDFGRYRVLTDTGLEIELNQPSNMSLKLSATDRYDSEPEGFKPHNLNYSALLIWKL
jgi:putative salt-induced outer membrane protein YdiY